MDDDQYFDLDAALAADEPDEPNDWAGSGVVAEYVYRWEDGTRAFAVLRHDPKAFTVVDADGAVLEDRPPAPLLYQLPELAAADPRETVYLCEGEKDAETVAAGGLVATTAPCGTRHPWAHAYTDQLAGRHVVILPDADGPGRRWAATTERALTGHAASVHVVHLWGDRRGQLDVTDWLASYGRTHDHLSRAVGEHRLAAAGLSHRIDRASKARMLLDARLPATEKATLLGLWAWAATNDAAAPTAAQLGQACGIHRVTAQRALGSLLDRRCLRREGRQLTWDWAAIAALG